MATEIYYNLDYLNYLCDVDLDLSYHMCGRFRLLLFGWQVYKVWNAAHGRMEALSVMDRQEIVGEEEVVSGTNIVPGFFMGHDSQSDLRVGSGGFQNLAGRVGSGQEVFEISLVGTGGFQLSRVGLDHPDLIRPNPTREN